jgi:hypothetical protein
MLGKMFSKVPSDVEQVRREANYQIKAIRNDALATIDNQKMILESVRLSLKQMDTINREKQIENDRLRFLVRGAVNIAKRTMEHNRKLRRKLNDSRIM